MDEDILHIQATRNGKEIGRLEIEVGEKSAEVHEVELDPEFQKKGLGQALYRKAAEHLQGRGIESLRTRVFQDPVGMADVMAAFPDSSVAKMGGADRVTSPLRPKDKFLPETDSGKEWKKRGVEFGGILQIQRGDG